MACESCEALKDAIADRDIVIAALLSQAAAARTTATQPACVFCGARVGAEAVQAWLTHADYPQVPADGFYRLCRRCDGQLAAQQRLEAARW